MTVMSMTIGSLFQTTDSGKNEAGLIKCLSTLFHETFSAGRARTLVQFGPEA
jgi:hypothetical protein